MQPRPSVPPTRYKLVLVVFAALGLVAGGLRSAEAASLPSGLSTAEVHRVTQLLAMGGATRLLRSAESYPPLPGLKVGVDLTFLAGNQVSELGNRDGSVNLFLPNPRLYLAKGLAPDTEIVLSFFPSVINTVAGFGGIFKWTLLKQRDEWATVAATAGLTNINAFRGEFRGSTLELGVVISRDYVRLKPYAGAALAFARGQVLAELAQGAPETGVLMGSHLYIGAEWELPVNLAIQADLFNLDPMVTFFAGARF